MRPCPPQSRMSAPAHMMRLGLRHAQDEGCPEGISGRLVFARASERA